MNGHEKLKNQSRDWLADALLDLMKKRPYQDITIGQIADHAGLSRRTFYRSFKNKEEVMDYITTSMSLLYEQHIIANQFETFDFQKIAHIFFSFFETHYEFLKLLQKNGLEFQILKLFNHYLPIICNHLLADRILPDSTLSREQQLTYIRYFSRFNCGGFFNLLLFWLEQETPLNAATMETSITAAFATFWNLGNAEAVMGQPSR